MNKKNKTTAWASVLKDDNKIFTHHFLEYSSDSRAREALNIFRTKKEAESFNYWRSKFKIVKVEIKEV